MFNEALKQKLTCFLKWSENDSWSSQTRCHWSTIWIRFWSQILQYLLVFDQNPVQFPPENQWVNFFITEQKLLQFQPQKHGLMWSNSSRTCRRHRRLKFTSCFCRMTEISQSSSQAWRANAEILQRLFRSVKRRQCCFLKSIYSDRWLIDWLYIQKAETTWWRTDCGNETCWSRNEFMLKLKLIWKQRTENVTLANEG